MMRPLLALLLLPLATYGADTIHLTGREAEAVQLATQVFKSKQGSKDQEGHPVYGDLRHYTVQIERNGRNLEVIFVPEQPPLKPTKRERVAAPFTAGKSTTLLRSTR